MAQETKEIKMKTITKDLPETCRNVLAQRQSEVNIAVTLRNRYLEGVADALGLQGDWRFDFDGFVAGKTCCFTSQVKDEEANK